MDINLLDYKKILELAENKGENKFHLLLGNGFNNSLGIKTDYKSIFQEMQKEYAGYQDLTDIMKEKNYDLEILLEGLETQIQSTNSNQNFLKVNKLQYFFLGRYFLYIFLLFVGLLS